MFERTLILACVAGAVAGELFTTDATKTKELWDAFKVKFHKKYDTMEEENHRFNNFLESLRLADMRNKVERKSGGSAMHGVTFFSDLSQAEFESRYLTAESVPRDIKEQKASTVNGQVDTAIGLVDWTGKYTSPVKDQVMKLFCYFCVVVF